MKKSKWLSVFLSFIMITTLFFQFTVVNAEVGGTFTAEIVNIPTGSEEKKIDCVFKITKEAVDNEPGEVQIGKADTAIEPDTEGMIKIPNTVIDSSTSKEYKVTAIGDYAFYNCKKIVNTGLEDNQSIIKVGDKAYKECESITSTGLTNNHSVESIGVSSFELCINLLDTGLSGNDTLTTIGIKAFLNCKKLTKTGLENNKILKTLPNTMFQGCIELQSTGLESNNTITSIGSNVFNGCSGLKTTGLKENKTLTSLGAGMFVGCESLTSTGLEENEYITAIPNQTFQNCTGLTRLVLGKNSKIQSLGRNTFNGCTNLTKVIFGGETIPALDDSSFPNTNVVLYYPSWASKEDVAKLNNYKNKVEFGVSDVSVDTSQLNDVYKVGENMSLDGLDFTVGYKASNEADTLFEDVIKYAKDNELFSYTPIQFSEGKNTIKGTYRGVEFNFDVNAHGHTYSSDWHSNSTDHWHECVCGDKSDYAKHIVSDWIVDKAASLTETGSQHKECTICRHKMETVTIPKLLEDVIVHPEEKDDETKVTIVVNDEAKQVLEETIVDIAKNIDTTQAISDETREVLKAILEEDTPIQIVTNIEIVSDDKVSEDDLDKIQVIVDDNGQVVHYLDLKVNIVANSEIVGTINSLNEKVTFTVTVPKDLLKEGRTFYVVRVHDGEAEKLPVTMNEDGTITFKTDKFSTYALVYEDAATTTPDTGEAPKPTEPIGPVEPITPETPKDDKVDTSDNSVAGIYASVCGMALLAGGIVVLKKKKENLMNK